MQGQTIEAIDSAFEEAYNTYKNLEIESALKSSFEINKQSRKIKYEKGEVRSLLLIAECLMILGEYQKSLEYTQKVETFKKYLDQTPYDHWIAKRTAFECYLAIGLDVMAKIEYNNALIVLGKEKNKQKKNIGLFNMYILSEDLIFDNVDSIGQYLHSALNLMQDSSFKAHQKEHYSINLAGIYIKLGNYYNTKKNDPDSVLHYYALANNELEHNVQHFYYAHLKEGYSIFFEQKGEPREAIAKRLQALEIFKHWNIDKDVLRNYNKLSELYGKIGEKEKEKEYSILEKALKDSLEVLKSQGRDEAILHLVKEKENEMLVSETKYKVTIIVITFCLIVILLLTIYFFNRYIKKKKNQILKENEQRLAEKEQMLLEKEIVLHDSIEIIEQNNKKAAHLQNVIEQKEQETQLLKEKVRESFAEIVQLAKENDPHFWTRFQEIYPQFATNLLEVNPLLKPSELTFCAYIYLGFTTKEIADYTFRAVKTIESNRYNIRKRLFLKPETDLQLFLNNKL